MMSAPERSVRQNRRDPIMNEISTEAFEALTMAVEAHDGSVLPDYSGRGMFGRTCVGFTCNSLGDFARILLALKEEHADELADWLAYGGEVQRDNLGMDTLYYFPGLSVEGLDRVE